MSSQTEPHTAEERQPLRSPTSGLGELQPSGEIRILIIDDEPSTCNLIRAALANQDFRIDSVSEPGQVEAKLRPAPAEKGEEEAEEKARPQNLYHLIILDYVLPGLEPDQVFGWIRDYQPEASVIVVTGYPSFDSALKSLRAGTVFDYLTKPFQIEQLRESVLRCLEGKGLLRMTEEALRESLGAAIRERRKALGLTLHKMSQRTGVSLGYLSQIELGKNSASIETLYKICLALGIKMADLFQAVQKS
ncbi:MAG TPA: response regulator [Gemmataceae bacterium]